MKAYPVADCLLAAPANRLIGTRHLHAVYSPIALEDLEGRISGPIPIPAASNVVLAVAGDD